MHFINTCTNWQETVNIFCKLMKDLTSFAVNYIYIYIFVFTFSEHIKQQNCLSAQIHLFDDQLTKPECFSQQLESPPYRHWSIGW